jgi:toluene monooxygenase system ferredoxin subunit
MTFHAIMEAEALWPGEMKAVQVERVKVLVANLDGSVVAYENRCAHLGMELSKGRLEGSVLTCSAHHWTYDLCDGRGLNPGNCQLRRFPIKIEGGAIHVDVGDG